MIDKHILLVIDFSIQICASWSQKFPVPYVLNGHKLHYPALFKSFCLDSWKHYLFNYIKNSNNTFKMYNDWYLQGGISAVWLLPTIQYWAKDFVNLIRNNCMKIMTNIYRILLLYKIMVWLL